MYDFINTDEVQMSDVLPSETCILDGIAIDVEIPEFTTLTVSGREAKGRSLNTADIAGRDGSLFMSSQLESRVLTVLYKVEATSNQHFRDVFNRLNVLLHKKQHQISFMDELDYFYIGTLETVDDVPAGTNTIVSSLSFFCSDPYKYGKLITLVSDNDILPSIDTKYLTLPTELIVVPSVDTATITIRTSEKEIKLVEGSFLANEPVSILYGNEITVTSANGNDTNKIALHSDLENFYIQKDVPVSLVEQGQLTIKLREVLL